MAQLSASEKQEALFQKWFSPEGIKFASPDCRATL